VLDFINFIWIEYAWIFNCSGQQNFKFTELIYTKGTEKTQILVFGGLAGQNKA